MTNNQLQSVEPKALDYVVSPVFKKELTAALPTGANVDRYARGVKTALLFNPDLQKCSTLSIIQAVLTCAQIGLEIDAKQHAYLIPYGGAVQVMPGYKGYLKKIQESAIVKMITSQVVYEGDKFEVFGGTEMRIDHRPNVEAHAQRVDENIIFIYSVIHFKNGALDFEVMSRSEIDKIKASAKTSNVWNKHYGEMGRKTVIRRFAKRLQLPETENILQVDDAHSQGFISNMDTNGELIKETGEGATVPNDPAKNTELMDSIRKHINSKRNKLDEEKFKLYVKGIFNINIADLDKLETDQYTRLLKAIKREYPNAKK